MSGAGNVHHCSQAVKSSASSPVLFYSYFVRFSLLREICSSLLASLLPLSISTVLPIELPYTFKTLPTSTAARKSTILLYIVTWEEEQKYWGRCKELGLTSFAVGLGLLFYGQNLWFAQNLCSCQYAFCKNEVLISIFNWGFYHILLSVLARRNNFSLMLPSIFRDSSLCSFPTSDRPICLLKVFQDKNVIWHVYQNLLVKRIKIRNTEIFLSFQICLY